MNMSELFITQPEATSIVSNRPGPHCIIVVGVHGNEPVGINILPWLRNLTIESGTVTIIVANPSAVSAGRRYINVNLNRRFGKAHDEYPEDTLARSIESYLDKADAVLDIHSYNESMDKPFIIANPLAEELATALPVELISTNWHQLSSGATDDYMASRNKPGICLECGSSERPAEYEALAKASVTAFLAAVGNITSHESHKPTHTHLAIVRAELKSEEDFSFVREFQSFDKLEAGAVFAQQGDTTYIAGKNECIVFPRANAAIGDEVFIIGQLK